MAARVAFLCSGGGANLRLLHTLASLGAPPRLDIASVIADRECPAVAWAQKQGLRAETIAYTRSNPEALHQALAEAEPDLVVTSFHKILDERLVDRFSGRLLNLHYSLLPSFGGMIGMEPVRAARSRGCRLIGATAHLVTAEVDAGPILAQASVEDDGERAERETFDAVFRCGGVALAAAVTCLLDSGAKRAGGILSAGGVTMLAAPLPSEAARLAFEDPAFWEALR